MLIINHGVILVLIVHPSEYISIWQLYSLSSHPPNVIFCIATIDKLRDHC